MSTGKIGSADEAIATIRSGSTLVVGGAGGVQEPDLLLSTLVAHFRGHGTPRDLVEVHPFRCGESDGCGTSLLDEPGLISRMIGGSYWPIGSTGLIERILNGEIEAYNLPVGTIYAMLEAAAAGRPGVITQVGVGTFADPRVDGGGLNAKSDAAFARVTTIADHDYLYYDAIRPDVAFIRGTVADHAGNVSMHEEPARLGGLLLAQATHANGGTVIAQVREVVADYTLDPHLVVVPGALVDVIVPHAPQRQIPASMFDASLVSPRQITLDPQDIQGLNPAKVVQRRALLECCPGDTLVIGFGLPGQLPGVALEEGVFDMLTFTVEHGPIGGINPFSRGAKTFPAAHHPQAIVDAADQLRWYAGGSLQRAILGAGEIDRRGNVNVSRFGRRIPGCGGFVDITDGMPNIVFTFILGDRGNRKVVERVQQITFSGVLGAEKGQRVIYISEKAVFRLTPDGLELTEVAPGLDPEEIVDSLGTRVAISAGLVEMPSECWGDGPMRLAERGTWSEK